MKKRPEPQQWQQGDQFDEGYPPVNKSVTPPAPPPVAEPQPQGFAERVKALAAAVTQRLR